MTFKKHVFVLCSGGERVNQGNILTLARTTRGKMKGGRIEGKRKLSASYIPAPKWSPGPFKTSETGTKILTLVIIDSSGTYGSRTPNLP